MPWILNVAYLLLLAAVSPLLFGRAFFQGKYRDGWREKLLGLLPQRDGCRPCLWLHAVSVGEVLQLQPLLRELESRLPEFEFLITTTTSTGLAVAREKFPQHRVCYFPLDFSWSVSRAIRRVRPSAVVLVELELWPNFIAAASQAGIPLALINGRISEKSYAGYRRLRPLMRRMLERFSLLAVQSGTYASRLLDLGAPAARVEITGSIKFDGVETNRDNPRTLELKQSFGMADDEPVFIAGSTQAPEEELAIDTWLEVLREFPGLRLVLVPRHKERFDEVAELVLRRGLPLIRRSQRSGQWAVGSEQVKAHGWQPVGPLPSSSAFPAPRSALPVPPVLLLDTLGELSACWGLADIAFVGGSLTKRGGQNMLEPSAYGAAVLFGPNTHNFRQIVEALLSREAALVVRNGDELTAAVRRLLADPQSGIALGKRARVFVLAQQGATARTAALLTQILGVDNPDVENSDALAA